MVRERREGRRQWLFFALFHFVFLAFAQVLSSVELLYPKVIAQFPHDPNAFTQGLAVEGKELYESTGLYGESTLRCYDLSKKQMKMKKVLPQDVFAEGIALFPDRLIQLTWQGEQAFIYERSSFKRMESLPYRGEGWGLCRDQETVWMSNGTSFLVQRDGRTFQTLNTLNVRLEGRPLSGLNDLECVGEDLYANVWLTDCILRINKKTGEVTGVIDASPLLSDQERKGLGPNAVLNGIAFQAATQTFFVTGKQWPWMFQVRFISASLRAEQPWKYIRLKN